MEAAGNRLNIVILDACRNNPFARKFRSSSSGLAQMDAPVGTLIAFATAPGSVARDGQGENGLYTQHLLRAMKQPGARIEDVFKNVRAGVRKESQGQQIPWESTSLEGDFVFNPLPPKASNVPRQSDATSVKRIDHIDAPRLKPGDSWKTQTIDLLNGSVIEENTLTLADGTAGEWRFERLVTDTSWNAIREMSGARVMRKWVPSRSRFRFPMQVGNAWSATYTMEDDDYTIFFIVDFKVIRQERIVVPAGVFDCLRVEGTQKYKSTRKRDGSNGEGTNVHRYWFSPEAGWIAAYESEVTNWKGVVSRKTREELISYKR
jgi:hypothetical protein